MTIRLKAVEQYFTVVLFVNPLTPRLKPWVIQSFLTLILWIEPLSVTIHWKAVEQYFTVVLFVNPLTPRVKPWVIQSFLTFDSMYRNLKCGHSLESCSLLWCCNFSQFVILENLPVLDLILSGVKGLTSRPMPLALRRQQLTARDRMPHILTLLPRDTDLKTKADREH